MGFTWEDLEFDSGGLRCRGRLARPAGAGETRLPCVVLGHGLGATKEGSLREFAERFVAAGLSALIFDYRHFGESEGEPRQVISIGRQLDDWHAAVAYVRTRQDVDPDRVGLWGTSFGGGHVVRIASRDKRIAAVVAQVPFVSGVASTLAVPPKSGVKVAPRALADLAGGLIGRDPLYVDTVGPEGSTALLTTDAAYERYPAIFPEGAVPQLYVAARIGLTIAFYSPLRDAPRVESPLLVVVAEGDEMTPPGPARKVAERAPRGELITFPGSHFEPYFGETFDRISAAEAEFLASNLLA